MREAREGLPIIKAMQAFADSHPEALPRLWESVNAARTEAVTLIAGTGDVEDRVAALELSDD